MLRFRQCEMCGSNFAACVASLPRLLWWVLFRVHVRSLLFPSLMNFEYGVVVGFIFNLRQT